MERVINKDKQKAMKVFDEIYWELSDFEDIIYDLKVASDNYRDCDAYNEECLDVLDKHDNDCTLEKKMRELVRLHNEFEKALDAYKNYVEENF